MEFIFTRFFNILLKPRSFMKFSGHKTERSFMNYLKLDIAHKRQIQKKITEHTQSPLEFDPKLEEALDWENSEKTLAWLDSL